MGTEAKNKQEEEVQENQQVKHNYNNRQRKVQNNFKKHLPSRKNYYLVV